MQLVVVVVFSCCDKTIEESTFKRGKVHSGSRFESAVYLCGENIVIAHWAAGHIALQSGSREREINASTWLGLSLFCYPGMQPLKLCCPY